MLNVGQVSVAKDGMAEFRIRSNKSLLQHIIPIFNRNSLLTSKYYDYDLFKKGLRIITDDSISKDHKHLMLLELKEKNKIKPNNYISPA
jgi:LAGLIDADG endonuclease